MTPQEHLIAYLELRKHGYSASEANKIIEEIKEKMKTDKA